MFKKAIAAGLSILQADLDAVEQTLAETLGVSGSTAVTPSGFDPIKNDHRRLFPKDKFHYSIMHVQGAHNPPDGAFIETSELEAVALQVPK